DDPQRLVNFFAAMSELRAAGQILAYHDRSDGGLFVTLAEMAFAGHCGVDASLACEAHAAAAALFSEELGAVIQVRAAELERVLSTLARHGLGELSREIGRVTAQDRVRILAGGVTVLDETRTDLHRAWSET